MSAQSTFEIDLLDFHGEALELEFEVSGEEAGWVIEGATDALRIDKSEPFVADLRAQLVGTTVHISGYLEGRFHARCGRCLQWRVIDLDEEVDFVLMSRPSWEDAYGDADEIALSAEDLDVSYYDEEILNLRPLIREAVLLELPSFPLCPEELSKECDATFEQNVGEETLAENEANSIDLRWQKLREIKLDSKDES